jgi:hypothetical protein
MASSLPVGGTGGAPGAVAAASTSRTRAAIAACSSPTAPASSGREREPLSGSHRDAAHQPVPEQLDHLDPDRAPPRLIAHRELGERLGQASRIEQHLDHALAGAHDAPDPRGKIAGELVRLQCALDHGERPPFELRAGGVQPVVDRRQREAEKGGDVLLRALVHVEERDNLPQGSRQAADRVEHRGDPLAILDPRIGQHLPGGNRRRRGQGQDVPARAAGAGGPGGARCCGTSRERRRDRPGSAG